MREDTLARHPTEWESLSLQTSPSAFEVRSSAAAHESSCPPLHSVSRFDSNVRVRRWSQAAVLSSKFVCLSPESAVRSRDSRGIMSVHVSRSFLLTFLLTFSLIPASLARACESIVLLR